MHVSRLRSLGLCCALLLVVGCGKKTEPVTTVEPVMNRVVSVAEASSRSSSSARAYDFSSFPGEGESSSSASSTTVVVLSVSSANSSASSAAVPPAPNSSRCLVMLGENGEIVLNPANGAVTSDGTSWISGVIAAAAIGSGKAVVAGATPGNGGTVTGTSLSSLLSETGPWINPNIRDANGNLIAGKGTVVRKGGALADAASAALAQFLAGQGANANGAATGVKGKTATTSSKKPTTAKSTVPKKTAAKGTTGTSASSARKTTSIGGSGTSGRSSSSRPGGTSYGYRSPIQDYSNRFSQYVGTLPPPRSSSSSSFGYNGNGTNGSNGNGGTPWNTNGNNGASGNNSLATCGDGIVLGDILPGGRQPLALCLFKSPGGSIFTDSLNSW